MHACACRHVCFGGSGQAEMEETDALVEREERAAQRNEKYTNMREEYRKKYNTFK